MNEASSVSAYLEGDWTINGIVRQIDPLMELSSCWDRSGSEVKIDCSGIAEIDLCGFQLLYTWLHCLEIRGIKQQLVNVSEAVQLSQSQLGLKNLFETKGSC
jgi:ABC-type transporter Mla MlaB component